MQKINKEILTGRIREPFKEPPFDNLICSPLGLVPKKESGFFFGSSTTCPFLKETQLIFGHHMNIVSYQNIETVIELVQENGFKCLMAKADIQDAFRLIPIHPS